MNKVNFQINMAFQTGTFRNVKNLCFSKYPFPLIRFIKYNLLVNLINFLNLKVLLLVNFLFDWGKKKSSSSFWAWLWLSA